MVMGKRKLDVFNGRQSTLDNFFSKKKATIGVASRQMKDLVTALDQEPAHNGCHQRSSEAFSLQCPSRLSQQPRDPPVQLRLNEEQQSAAAASLASPLVILAGAGTGKTTTLLGRIQHMLVKGRVFAREILAISFTNKAATELRERLKSLGSEGADSVRVGTFHSWCFAVLRQNYKAAGFEKAPVVWATESDRKTAISEAIRWAGLEKARVEAADTLSLRSGASWNDILDAAKVKDSELYKRCDKAALAKCQKSPKSTSKAKSTSAVVATGKYMWQLVAELLISFQLSSAEKLGEKPSVKEVNEMLKWIDKAKRGNERPEAFLQTSKEYFVYKYYQVALKRANAVDFDDLLLLVSDLMKRDMRIRGRLQAMHRYVLVDEYQDCSPAQIELISYLRGKDGRVTVVGDDAQSIYGFRGSDVGVFWKFLGGTSESTNAVKCLEVNYRSRPNIIYVAESFLKGSFVKLEPKALQPAKDNDKQPVEVWECRTASHEAELIARRAKTLNEVQKVAYEEMAVLFRSFKCGGGPRTHELLEAALIKEGIKYRIVGSYSILERAAAKDLLAYPRLLLNPEDDASFRRIFNVPNRGLGKVFIDAVTDQQDALQMKGVAQPCLMVVVEKMLRDGKFSASHTKAVRTFLKMIETMRMDVWTMTVPEIILHVLKTTNYVAYFEKKSAKPGFKEETEEDDEDAEVEAPTSSDDDEEELKPPAEVPNRVQEGWLPKTLDCILDMAKTFSQGWEGVTYLQCLEGGKNDGGADDAQREGCQTLFEMCVDTVLEGKDDRCNFRATVEHVPPTIMEHIYGARKQGFLPLTDFLAHLSLSESGSAEEQDSNGKLKQKGLVISTIHRAKGLEWDAVFVPRCNEDHLPSQFREEADLDKHCAVKKNISKEQARKDHLDEERRLAHVAATRAKEHLFLNHWAKESETSEYQFTKSQFLNRLPTEEGVVSYVAM